MVLDFAFRSARIVQEGLSYRDGTARSALLVGGRPRQRRQLLGALC